MFGCHPVFIWRVIVHCGFQDEVEADFLIISSKKWWKFGFSVILYFYCTLFAATSKKDLPDKFDRQQWKIMQLAMTDSIKFVDMLHNVPWEDGLPGDTREGTKIITLYTIRPVIKKLYRSWIFYYINILESTSRIIVRDTLYKIVHFVSPVWITTHSSAKSGSEPFVNLLVIYRCIYITAVENYLAKSKDGSFGITGEGTLLDNAAGKLNITSGLGIVVLE